jgi:hypothetical protein
VAIWNALLSLADIGTTIILTTHYVQVELTSLFVWINLLYFPEKNIDLFRKLFVLIGLRS